MEFFNQINRGLKFKSAELDAENVTNQMKFFNL